jgi:hypothetical protein
MKFLPNIPFKSLALGGAVALIVSSAYAATWEQCLPTCTQNAENAYNQSKAYYTQAQTNYCNSLTDPAAKNACLAGVPSYAEQQAQNVKTQAFNSCMNGCTHV